VTNGLWSKFPECLNACTSKNPQLCLEFPFTSPRLPSTLSLHSRNALNRITSNSNNNNMVRPQTLPTISYSSHNNTPTNSRLSKISHCCLSHVHVLKRSKFQFLVRKKIRSCCCLLTRDCKQHMTKQ
jgi:hypothetical protein